MTPASSVESESHARVQLLACEPTAHDRVSGGASAAESPLGLVGFARCRRTARRVGYDPAQQRHRHAHPDSFGEAGDRLHSRRDARMVALLPRLDRQASFTRSRWDLRVDLAGRGAVSDGAASANLSGYYRWHAHFHDARRWAFLFGRARSSGSWGKGFGHGHPRDRLRDRTEPGGTCSDVSQRRHHWTGPIRRNAGEGKQKHGSPRFASILVAARL